MAPEPWNEPLREAKAIVEAVAGHRFNSVLLNYYRDGRDSVSWHADDEAALGEEPTIASLSLGATRDFQFRRKREAELELETVTLALESGSLLVMRHPTNANWKHRLPRRGGGRPERVGERLSLTWRWTASDRDRARRGT